MKKISIIIFCALLLLLCFPIIKWCCSIADAVSWISQKGFTTTQAIKAFLEYRKLVDTTAETIIVSYGAAILYNLQYIFVQLCAIGLVSVLFGLLWRKNFTLDEEEYKRRKIEKLQGKIDKIK